MPKLLEQRCSEAKLPSAGSLLGVAVVAEGSRAGGVQQRGRCGFGVSGSRISDPGPP